MTSPKSLKTFVTAGSQINFDQQMVICMSQEWVKYNILS